MKKRKKKQVLSLRAIVKKERYCKMLEQINKFLRQPKVLQTQLIIAIHILLAYSDCRENYKRNHQYNSNSTKWLWRGFPKKFSFLVYIRNFALLWQAYAVVRDLFSSQLESVIESIFTPTLPARCYLLGRFVLPSQISKPGFLLSLSSLIRLSERSE